MSHVRLTGALTCLRLMVRGRSTGVELSHNTKLPQVTMTLDGVVFVVVFCLFGLVLPVGNLAARCLAWCCCFVLGMFRLFQIISPTIIKWRWASLGRAVLKLHCSVHQRSADCDVTANCSICQHSADCLVLWC